MHMVTFIVPEPEKALEPDDIREFVRHRLRGARTPDEVVLVSELPRTKTGKVLRRQLVRLVSDSAAGTNETASPGRQ